MQLDVKEDVAVERLRRLGLSRFIRITEGVDKVGILREPQAIEAVEGIAVVCPETTVTITPNTV